MRNNDWSVSNAVLQRRPIWEGTAVQSGSLVLPHKIQSADPSVEGICKSASQEDVVKVSLKKVTKISSSMETLW